MSYDARGNLSSVAGGIGVPAASYSYDALGRLASAAVGGASRSYQFDDFGNLLDMGGTSFSVNHETNRLTGANYSLWGTQEARTTASGWRLHTEHDVTGALVAVWGTVGKDEKAVPPLDVHTFVYGPGGERVGVFELGSRGRVRSFHWETRGLDGNVLVEYLWTRDGGWAAESEWLYLGREPVARMEGGKLYALVRDHLGSVRAEVSVGSDGSARIHRADYWPFGEEITTTLDPTESHRFTAHWREYRGEVKDASVLEGLDFMHAREYDWRTARFTAPDPAAASWNAYAYVVGNPVNFVDPWGLEEEIYDGGFHGTIEVVARDPDWVRGTMGIYELLWYAAGWKSCRDGKFACTSTRIGRCCGWLEEGFPSSASHRTQYLSTAFLPFRA